MSNRSLLEFNHDYVLPADSDLALARWARRIQTYLSSGDDSNLPAGVELKWTRHHSEDCPVEKMTRKKKP